MELMNRASLFVLQAATGGKKETPKDTGKVDSTIYGGGSTEVNDALLKVIKYVGGIGGTVFTLAILIIALVIIFGSISSKNIGTVWKAFFSCLAGAILFYSAYILAPSIAGIFS
ncbi:TrbC/VirB2 family protein [Rummeliibacillus stabekisii]|uniref:TrbC/VirB2 family protein n=1 Tax=Rummeliibacillus stabekisii TaxID=241244 RepID=UPI003717A96F